MRLRGSWRGAIAWRDVAACVGAAMAIGCVRCTNVPGPAPSAAFTSEHSAHAAIISADAGSAPRANPSTMAERRGASDDTAREKLRAFSELPADAGLVPRAPFVAPGLPEDLARAMQAPTPREGLAPEAGMSLDEVEALARWALATARAPEANAKVSPRDRQTSLRAYLSGRLALGEGDAALATRRLEQAAQLNPGALEPQRALGEALVASGDYRMAAQAFHQAAALGPLEARPLAFVAQEASQRGDHEEAIRFALAAIKADRADPEPELAITLHRALAESLASLGYAAASREALARALEPFDEDADAVTPQRGALRARLLAPIRLELGDAQFRAGEYAGAVESYQSAASAPGHDAGTLEPRLMSAAVMAGRPWLGVFRAFQSLENGRGRLSDAARLRLQAAATLPGARAPLTDAIREWRDESREASPSLAARLSLAALSLASGDAACAGLEEHLAIAPDDASAASQWLTQTTPDERVPAAAASLLARAPRAGESLAGAICGSGERATRLLAEIAKAANAKQSPAVRLLHARIRARAGDFRNAIEATRGMDSPEALLVRGLASADMGDIGEAIACRDALAAIGTQEATEHAARVAIRAGEAPWAAEALTKWLAAHEVPAAPAAGMQVLRAEALGLAGDARGALAALRAAFEAQADLERGHALMLALTQAQGPAPDAALAAGATRALQSLGEDGRELTLARAREALRMRSAERAARLLESMLASDPLDPTALPLAIEAQEALAREAPANARGFAERIGRSAARLDAPLLRLGRARVLSAALVALAGRDTTIAAEARALLEDLRVLEAEPLRWPADLHDRRLVMLTEFSERDEPGAFAVATAFARAQYPALRERASIRAALLADRKPLPRTALAMLREAMDQSDAIEPALIQRALSLIPEVGDAGPARQIIDLAHREGLLQPAVLPNGAALADPRAEVAYTLGTAAWSRQHEAAAFGLLELALSYDPEHAWAANDLGYFLADAGRELERAERLLTLAFRKLPATASIVDSLAWLRYKQSRLEDFADAATGERRPGAKSLLQSASQMPDGEDNPAVFDHLGDTLWRLGDRDGAIRAWEVAERLLPRRMARLNANREEIVGDGPFADTQARANAVRAKLTAARAGQEAMVAPQGEHGVPASDPPR